MSFALSLSLTMVPGLAFSLIGGLASDRFDRLKVLIVVDVLQMLISSSLGVLASENILRIWELYVAAFLFGTCRSFRYPAAMGVVPALIKDATLEKANSMLGSLAQAATLIGPLLANAAITLTGVAMVFFIDGFSFVMSILSIFLIIGLVETRVKSAPEGAVRGYGRILRELRKKKRLFGMLLFSSVLSLAVAPLYASTPKLASEYVVGTRNGLTILWVTLTAGYLLGATLLTKISASIDRVKMFFVVHAPIVIGFWLLPYASFFAVRAIYIILGATQALAEIIMVSVIQSESADHQRGAVFALFNMMGMWTAPIGLLLAGLVADHDSVYAGFLGGGLLMLAGVLIGILNDYMLLRRKC